MSSTNKKFILSLLKRADIKVNGKRPWDVEIHNPLLYDRIVKYGSVGLGESYMEGWWDVRSLDQFFYKLLIADLSKTIKPSSKEVISLLRAKFFNLQTKSGSIKVAKQHYDLPSELYMSFLDPYNQYSCGYFKNTKDLNQAQEQKMELICRKLQIKKGDRVLDIGCGWGGFAKYASLKYGCEVVGITISQEQANFAKEFVKGLPVVILVKDYRDINEKFDKVVSVGMLEHVGHKNYKTLIKKVRQILEDDGLFLLHTIGTQDSGGSLEPWLNKYIFPNSQLPTLITLMKAIDNSFIVEDLHNFSAYYDPTLMAWMKNFDKNWSKFSNRYDEKFHRMFKYYFLCCAGSFRARKNQLWQIVLSKNGVAGGYESVR